jgi:hypothetical protein
MAVTALLDALAAHLSARLTGAASVGVAAPAAAVDLPLVALSLPLVQVHSRGVGGLPTQSRSGALPVTRTVNLAAPVSEGVDLISADRLVLQLPDGAIVRADGAGLPPFTPADLGVELDGAPISPVSEPPGPGQVSPDPVTGRLTFGTALPAVGSVVVRYFVGTWEVGVERYAGDLAAETFAADVDAVVMVSGAVADALAPAGGANVPPVAGLRRLEPRSIGPVLSAGATGDLAGARARRLTFAFDFELESPRIVSAGGPIRSIEVGLLPGPNNDFTVARGGN